LRGDDSGGFEPRQFQREARERRAEAQTLRRDLQALGVDVKDLDAVIAALAALDSTRIYTDADEITRLQEQLAQTLQRFQFNLRKELGEAAADQLFLSGSDAAPEAYRKQIEEYYRSLARDKKK
jgi:NACalpha-BTF3-like transcription factor